jgi:hypothetical protein
MVYFFAIGMPDLKVENSKCVKKPNFLVPKKFQTLARAISSPERHPAVELLGNFFLWGILASLDLDSRTQI